MKAEWSSSFSGRQKLNHGWQLRIKNSYGNVSTRSFRQNGLTWSEEAVCFSLVILFCCVPEKWFWKFLYFFHIATQTSGPFVKVQFLDFCPLLLFGSSIFLWFSYQVSLIWGAVLLISVAALLYFYSNSVFVSLAVEYAVRSIIGCLLICSLVSTARLCLFAAPTWQTLSRVGQHL